MIQQLQKRIEELEKEIKKLEKDCEKYFNNGWQTENNYEYLQAYNNWLIDIKELKILKEWLQKEKDILKLTRFSRDDIGMHIDLQGEFISFESLKKELEK